MAAFSTMIQLIHHSLTLSVPTIRRMHEFQLRCRLSRVCTWTCHKSVVRPSTVKSQHALGWPVLSQVSSQVKMRTNQTVSKQLTSENQNQRKHQTNILTCLLLILLLIFSFKLQEHEWMNRMNINHNYNYLMYDLTVYIKLTLSLLLVFF